MKGSPIGLPFQLVKKVLRGQRTGTHAPSPGAAKKSKVFRARSLRGNAFPSERWSFRRKKRPVPTLCICTADRQSAENSEKTEKLGTLIYGPQFRVLSGGSKWVSARPTGSKWLSALPTGSRLWGSNPEFSDHEAS